MAVWAGAEGLPGAVGAGLPPVSRGQARGERAVRSPQRRRHFAASCRTCGKGGRRGRTRRCCPLPSRRRKEGSNGPFRALRGWFCVWPRRSRGGAAAGQHFVSLRGEAGAFPAFLLGGAGGRGGASVASAVPHVPEEAAAGAAARPIASAKSGGGWDQGSAGGQ